MNAENQNTEWKESWREEYLKWICGFANAQGGKMYIGKENDGTVVGLKNAKKLLEDIPNKIQNKLGIVADMNLLETNGMEYIEIIVPPSNFSVNYEGQFHYRSGSTKQQLRGNTLTNFLIFKTGLRWDTATVDNIAIEDLDKESFDIFRREALRSGRMTKEDLDISNSELLDKLNLLVDGKLKRAAVLCFYRNPQRVINGCYVKIGKFEGSELLYQDEVHGSLLLMADRVIDLIYLKYLKASISYHKETRVETYPFARDAIREAVFNALIHCNWADNIPIQIRIEDECMFISNSCLLPFEWTEVDLIGSHSSRPFNPDIPNVFYRAGLIESWGRGIQKIFDACKTLGAKEPVYTLHPQDIMVKFQALDHTVPLNPVLSLGQIDSEPEGDETENIKDQDRKILELMYNNPKILLRELAQELEISISSAERRVSLLKKEGQIERRGNPRQGYWIVHNHEGNEPEDNEPENIEDQGRKILELMYNNPKILLRELAQELEISISSAKRKVASLKKEGRIGREGNARQGYWIVHNHEGNEPEDNKPENIED